MHNTKLRHACHDNTDEFFTKGQQRNFQRRGHSPQVEEQEEVAELWEIARLCVSRKGGAGGGEWVHLPSIKFPI